MSGWARALRDCFEPDRCTRAPRKRKEEDSLLPRLQRLRKRNCCRYQSEEKVQRLIFIGRCFWGGGPCLLDLAFPQKAGDIGIGHSSRSGPSGRASRTPMSPKAREMGHPGFSPHCLWRLRVYRSPTLRIYSVHSDSTSTAPAFPVA